MHLPVGTGTVTAIPKAGSASIRQALFGRLYDIPEREAPEGHWVAFVRHPLARLVSCYQHWIVNAFHHRMAVHGLTQGMPFADFVKAVALIPDADADMHFKSQSALIDGQPDYIGRAEAIGQDWKHVQSVFGVGPIGHHNRTDHAGWESFYCPELATIALERYQQDMENYYAGHL